MQQFSRNLFRKNYQHITVLFMCIYHEEMNVAKEEGNDIFNT
jgi:hypothetical protein